MNPKRYPLLAEIQAEPIVTPNYYPISESLHTQIAPVVTLEPFPTAAPELQQLSLEGNTAMRRWLAEPESDYSPQEVAVARQDGKPVGWAGISFTRGKRDAYPRISVFVKPDQRQHGIGVQLVDLVLKDWKDTTEDCFECWDIQYDDQWPKLRERIEHAGLRPVTYEGIAAALAVDHSFDPELLAGLLPTCTAPHREGRVEEWVEKWCRKHRIPHYRDGQGNVWLNAHSRQDAAKASLLLVAHLDHPGVMIESIDGLVAKGMWEGGGPGDGIEEHAVVVFNEDKETIPGRITKASYSRGRPKKITIELEREPRNPKGKWGAVLDIPCQQFAQEVWARSLDDLISVAACMEAIERAGLPEGVVVLLSHCEEIGERGIIQLLKDKRVDRKQTRVVVVDTTTGTPLNLGAGLLVREGDDQTLYSASMTEWLREHMQACGIPYELKRTDGRTDAAAFMDKDFEVGSVGMFLINPHNKSALGIQPEVISTRDYGRMIWFLTQLIKKA